MGLAGDCVWGGQVGGLVGSVNRRVGWVWGGCSAWVGALGLGFNGSGPHPECRERGSNPDRWLHSATLYRLSYLPFAAPVRKSAADAEQVMYQDDSTHPKGKVTASSAKVANSAPCLQRNPRLRTLPGAPRCLLTLLHSVLHVFCLVLVCRGFLWTT